MALPDNINTPQSLKQVLQHYATNHTLIDAFAFGKWLNLTNSMKSLKRGQLLLFAPFPSISPRDRSGAYDCRFISNISLIGIPSKKGDFQEEAIMLTKSYEVLNDLLLRMRSDASQFGWSFTINDISQIDPVLDHTLDDAVGAQLPLYFGDFKSVNVKSAVWQDLV